MLLTVLHEINQPHPEHSTLL